MTKEFFEEVMRIPSCSRHEDMMIEYLLEWGKSHGCRTKKDGKGNVYIEKGSGLRPCLINHIDTVHTDQKEMVEEKVYKEIVWKGDHVTAVNPLTQKQTGLGMDNQGGACIALAVIDRLSAVKAIFTVEEEIGMLGIRAADMGFFDDAAFVFSNDSPDENRATHYSSGVQLYSDGFFKEYLEPICKDHGVTSFRSEPWTCIKHVRLTWKDKDGKHLECLNFGNAGDRPHSDYEGASFKGVCNAEDLLYDLCTKIPCDKQHVSDIQEEPPRPLPTWIKGKTLSKEPDFDNDDQDFGSYVDELFGIGGSEDWQMHDDTDVCQFIFTYDSKEQFEKHQELCDHEGLFVSFGNFKEGSDTAMATAELQEMKDAYILWYQLFYDDPSVKTWDELEAVDDLTDFGEGIMFVDDADAEDGEHSDDLPPEDIDKKKETKQEQMDLFDWFHSKDAK